jgi:hypothetical protein
MLLRAERYLGHTWDVRRNLSLALAAGRKDAAPTLPWHRFLLFWHYGLDTGTRITLATLSFILVWIALFLRSLGPRRLAQSLLVAAVAGLVFFGSSAATSLIREASPHLPPITRSTQEATSSS